MKNLLLTFELLLFSIVFILNINAQEVNIPDNNFKQALIDIGVDTNNDGVIELAEALAINSLEIVNRSIRSLQGIEAFTNLKTLDCSSKNSVSTVNQLDTLDVNKLIHLEELYCGQLRLDYLFLDSISSLKVLDCGTNNIRRLQVEQFENLEILDCSSNRLQSLDLDSNLKLKELRCQNNPLNFLDFEQLTDLIWIDVSLTGIGNGRLDFSSNSKLFSISCYSMQLTDLNLRQNSELVSLYCANNNLSDLDLSQNSLLSSLRCESNRFEDLDVTHNLELGWLTCGNNLLSDLDLNNNSKMRILEVNDNSLSSLKVDHFNLLTKLNCNNNMIGNLELYNNYRLSEFSCDNNLIESLDLSSCLELLNVSCSNNELIFLNLRNGKNQVFIEHRDLEENLDLEIICVDEIEFSKVQGIVSSLGYDCFINEFCGIAEGLDNYIVSGDVKYDSDFCNDSSTLLVNTKLGIEANGDSGYLTTNNEGRYLHWGNTGAHSLYIEIENSELFDIVPSIYEFTFPTIEDTLFQDFCITPNELKSDLQIILMPLGINQAGFEASYQLIYKNIGSSAASGEIELSFQNEVMEYLSSSVLNSELNEHLIKWNYSDLLPFETRQISIQFKLNGPMDSPPLNSSDVLKFESIINPVTSDYNPADNMFTLSTIVDNSLDPNDIMCLEGDILDVSYIGEYVHYLVRFENLGSASAVNVRINSIIDSSLFDINSIQVIESSHNVRSIIQNDNLEFLFENINLSHQDSLNKGYVVYRIESASSLSSGDSLVNNANIFFDFNFPIVTNDAISTFELSSSTSDRQKIVEFSLSPNPTKGLIGIHSEQYIKRVEVYALNGELVYSYISQNPIKSLDLDLSHLADGVHIFRTYTDEGIGFYKFILLR